MVFSIVSRSLQSIAYSDWNDTIALSLCSGQVSVFAAKHMSVLTFKQPDFEKVGYSLVTRHQIVEFYRGLVVYSMCFLEYRLKCVCVFRSLLKPH